MATAADRIERKVSRLLDERRCDLCARRVEKCPSCGRAVGGLPGEGDEARHRIVAEIDRLAARRQRIAEQLGDPT